MNERMQRLVYELIDGTISADEFDELQHSLEHDPAVRSEYLKVVALCESLGDLAAEPPDAAESQSVSHEERVAARASRPRALASWMMLRFTIAAGLLAAVGFGAFSLGRSGRSNDDGRVVAAETAEPRIAGHATLRRAVGLKWVDGAARRFEGDLIPDGRFALEAGVAEIDFFSGATLIVEGPAELDIESDWVVRVAKGRIRANVPPAARGFVVKAAESEIVDLGTEFAVDVSPSGARVEVVDGEVELRGGDHDGRHLLTGEGLALKGPSRTTIKPVSTVLELGQQRRAADDRSFITWKANSAALRQDERVIAFFPIAEGLEGRTVPNGARSGSGSDGLIVGPVEQTTGRFGARSSGLEFDRAGSRVRTLIDGEYSAFTFACWVRIDSLPHRYNALFMSDGFENGEPHWQIRNDGRLMITVMVDDTKKVEHFSSIEHRTVRDAGLHKNYMTEPFWDLSKSGQWFHLVAVYDPGRRRVRQYINGRVACDETITPELLATTLRIGPAEIGNWGQPFRKTPEFAIRNLHGTIDELAIFDAALSEKEIAELYSQGKPTGY